MNARGCFTLDKFLAGRNLKEIEERIGFRKGRLSKGGIVVALSRLPGKGEFKVAGYTNVSLHNFVMPGGLDPNVLEKRAMEVWELTGGNRLLKVIPAIAHDPKLDPDEQYPHARGIPQWNVTTELPCFVAATLSDYPDGTYRPKY